MLSTPFEAWNVGQLSHTNVGAVMTNVEDVAVPVNAPLAVHMVPAVPDGTEIRIVPLTRPSSTAWLASVPEKVPVRSPVLTQEPLTAVPVWLMDPETSGSLIVADAPMIEYVPRHWPLRSNSPRVGAVGVLLPQPASRHTGIAISNSRM
jgi:hypothetical protein